MARQAKVSPGNITDHAVGVVAVGTLETVGAADLMRSGDALQIRHVAVTPVT
jgi:hypothetical protein